MLTVSSRVRENGHIFCVRGKGGSQHTLAVSKVSDGRENFQHIQGAGMCGRIEDGIGQSVALTERHEL